MKNLTKKQISCLIVLIVLLAIVFGYVFNIAKVRDRTVDSISGITVPFSLIVNPKEVDKGQTPPSINTKVDNLDSEKNQAIELVAGMNDSFKQSHKLSFLSNDQAKDLENKVSDTPYQYIYGITLVNIGRDHSGKYMTISCNQYNDTKKIVGYRYILHYQGNQIKTSKYVGKHSANYPPQYLLDNVVMGKPGISQSKSFMQELKTSIINSNLISGNDTEPGDFNQIATNLGLDSDKSNQAIYQFAKNANSRLTNYAVTGYEVTDVPRSTRIYVKQITDNKNYYYTLTYDRNTDKYSSFETGIKTSLLS